MQASTYQVLLFLGAFLGLSLPLGWYMAEVYEGRAPGLGRLLGPVERLIYRLTGTSETEEMDWKGYTVAVLLFNAAGFLFLYMVERLQGYLPFNPQGFPGVASHTALNTAVSFMTNTNWQSYGGENTMSYLTQMVGMAKQNFVSAASGMAVLVAFIRGLIRKETPFIGNFWVDMTRTLLYILVPASVILTLLLVSQGVVQNLRPYAEVKTLQGGTAQSLAAGPAASQIAIKQLGTNGGGFYNANSAVPFENPTPLSNFLEVLVIPLISAALCVTFGFMIKDWRQGAALLAAMTVMFVPILWFTAAVEQAGNPAVAGLGVDIARAPADDLLITPRGRTGLPIKPVAAPIPAAPGGNMEGKEVRFGPVNSAVWAVSTTATSNGSVNSMHDSFMPLGGLSCLFLMQLGEVVYGGVGCGLYGMLIFVILTVFIAGLMVGRTPEYLGKKIEPFEMKMTAVVILVMPLVVLASTAVASVTEAGWAGASNPGAHGFSQLLYAFTSQGNNNGSAFGGGNFNAPFFNLLGAFCMLVGRFLIKIPVLAIAGSLAAKKITPSGAGTLPTHTPLFIFLLIGVILIVGALTFVPALALGPVVEHLQLMGY